VPVGAAEKAAESLRGPGTEIRPLRIGGVGVRDSQRNLRIDLVDRRFHFAPLFADATSTSWRAKWTVPKWLDLVSTRTARNRIEPRGRCSTRLL
jgi:hypothetical protein